MSPLRVHAYLAILAGFCAWVGLGLATRLPWRLRPVLATFLAPALGLAALVLVATAYAWWGWGFADGRAAVLLLMAIGASVFLSPPPRDCLWPVLGAVGLAQVVALPMTLLLIKHGSFNPANDLFTYLVQAQWLQDHCWWDARQPPMEWPALSQPWMSVRTSTRLGSQSFLGAAQALLQTAWSCEALPSVALTGQAAAAMTVGGAVALVRQAGRWLPWGAAAVVGLLPNGAAFGTFHGFLPQVHGVALGFAGLLLAFAIPARAPTKVWPASILPGLLFAATLLVYPELVPLLGAAVMLGLLLAWVVHRGKAAKHFLASVALSGIAAALLCGPEIPRAITGLRLQAGVVVGNAVPWPPWHFAAHALGLASGPWDHDHFLGGSRILVAVLAGAMTLLAFLALRKTGFQLPSALLGMWGFLGVAGALFLYFRHGVPSPFPTGTGQSWSQFKLSEWACVPVMAIALAAFARLPGRARGAVWVLLIVLGAAGLQSATMLVEPRIGWVRGELGVRRNLLDEARRFAEEADRLIGAERLWLATPREQVKLAELLAYFWMHRPLVADWAPDGYVHAELLRQANGADLLASQWIVAADPVEGAPAVLTRGHLRLMRKPAVGILFQGADATRGREWDANGYHYWVEREAVLHAIAMDEVLGDQRPVLTMQLSAADEARPFTLEWLDGEGAVCQTDSLNVEGALRSATIPGPTLRETGRRVRVRLRGPTDTKPLPSSQPRGASFRLQNPVFSLSR